MNCSRLLLVSGFCLLLCWPAAAEEKAGAKGAKLSVTSQVLMKMDKLRKDVEQLDLTAAQKEELEKFQSEWGPKMKELLGKVRDALTEDQRTLAEETMKKAREQGKELRASLSAVESALTLTEDQKKTLDAVGQELQQLQKDIAKQILQVLTPEQREKIKAKPAGEQKKKSKET
jgi:Spy/CpxP family protein refolding chaperone